MSEITNEQWEAIEKELRGSMPRVEFEYQGRTLTIRRLRHNENESLLNVFIDGYIRGVWMMPENSEFDPIGNEVWFEKKQAVYKPKEKARLIKDFGKRKAYQYFPRLDEKVVTYSPTFGSARTLVRQYKKLAGLKLTRLGHTNRLETVSEERAYG